MTTTQIPAAPHETMSSAQVISIFEALFQQTRQRGGYPGLASLEQAQAAFLEFLEQRDALATALFELSSALPKHRKSLSNIAQQRRRNADLLASSILNHQDVSPDAYEKMLIKAKALQLQAHTQAAATIVER